jgi:hypothetical protein
MKFFKAILDELREKRLWPVAVALVAGLVAVPVLLSKSAHPAVIAQTPSGGQPVSGPSIPVSVDSSSAESRLTGRGRDPFTQQKTGSTPTTGTASSSNTAGGVTGATGAAPSSGTAGSTTAGGTGSSAAPNTAATTTTPAATIPTGKPKPAPAGLTATQSYHVTFSITNSAGGVDTIDPLERLSVLPNKQEPLLVELGVLKGGSRVLFVVQPGTVVSGPGTCTPGPIDCEILSLAQDQVERLSTQSPNGPVSVALFAVTGITADRHSSVAAAGAARRASSAAGRRLLRDSTLSAPSLFQYQPSLGAVVDLRNLTVGGS